MSQNADKIENLKRRRTLRRTVHKDLEDKILEWYNAARAQGGYISGPMIAHKAQELHKELGYTNNFSASNGWLDRFKIRNGIKLCGLREVKTESDTNAVAPFKSELQSLAEWYNLSLQQIYNADETDLFWKMLPNPETDMNEVKASVRAYRERLTVLACVNATGTHKLPLVCIGRGKRSRTFTSQESKSLPVHYYSQETAWMDHEIFKSWFQNHFVPAVRQHLRYQGLPETALLLIDRSSSHPSDQHLRSEDGFFFVQFFPSKVRSLMQPMEQGIIRDMKRHYRRELLTELIAKNVTIAEFHKNLTIKDAITGIAHGWEFVSEEKIRACFNKIFPSTDNDSQETDANEASVSLESFAKLIRNIPECADYTQDRLEKWLNCDDAEPKKDCNELKAADTDVVSDLSDENVVFIDVHESLPEKVEIVDTPQDVLTNSIIVQQDSNSLDEFIDDDDDEFVENAISQMQQQHQQSTHEHATEIIDEEAGEVTCKQAVDALNILLKFMKNDADSRYKDVIMLNELKKKLRKKLSEAAKLDSDYVYTTEQTDKIM